MNKLLVIFLLLLYSNGFSQNQISEIKNQSGATTQYVLESDKIFSSKLKGQFKISFIRSVIDAKQYLQITIPEANYRRIYLNDSIKLIFDDGSINVMNVVKEQNGYMLKDKGEWLIYQFYLPFIVEMSDSLLNKLSSVSVKDVYLICLGNTQDISGDYQKIYYPVSNSDKRKFQIRASKDVVFSRLAINTKGKEEIKLAAEKFKQFKSNQ